MFGFVVPKKCELKIKDFYAYRAAYCSLCAELKRLGPFAKLTLGYDFTFAAILALALSDESIEGRDGRCTTNPFLRQRFISCGDVFPFAAACSLLTVKYKLLDDLCDERLPKRIKSACVYAALHTPFRRAKEKLPEFDELFKALIERQRAVESANENSCDRAADETAKCLSVVFERLSPDEPTKRVMSRLGYLVGKFVYLADALGDLSDDIRLSRYNPAAVKHSLSPDSAELKVDEAKADLKAQLYAVQSELATCYNLLDIKRYKPVLDNIIFLGLAEIIENPAPAKKEEVFNGRPV